MWNNLRRGGGIGLKHFLCGIIFEDACLGGYPQALGTADKSIPKVIQKTRKKHHTFFFVMKKKEKNHLLTSIGNNTFKDDDRQAAKKYLQKRRQTPIKK